MKQKDWLLKPENFLMNYIIVKIHKRPSFNLLIEDEDHKCFHYSNLQPLWAKDNLSKSANF